MKWLWRWPWKVRNFYFSNALKAFGFKKAREILPYNVLNAGAFAMRGDASHWARWQNLVQVALQKGKVFTAEQLTLGMLTYLDGYPAEILPAWTQWMCETKPMWDSKKRQFVEPFLPHELIGFVHISGYDKMRVDRKVTTEVRTTDDTVVDYTFRYQGFDGEREVETGS